MLTHTSINDPVILSGVRSTKSKDPGTEGLLWASKVRRSLSALRLLGMTPSVTGTPSPARREQAPALLTQKGNGLPRACGPRNDGGYVGAIHESPARHPAVGNAFMRSAKPSPGGKVAEHKRGRMRNAGRNLPVCSIRQAYSCVVPAAVPLPSFAAQNPPSPRERVFVPSSFSGGSKPPPYGIVEVLCRAGPTQY